MKYQVLLPMVLLLLQIPVQAKKSKFINADVSDFKEFKKLLKTKTNVLILYVNSVQSSAFMLEIFKETALLIKGQATLVIIDCIHGETKKLCKKMKIASDKPYVIKHYKDGEFHKDYDRSETVTSMYNFLKDPTGDLPWEEDPDAADIFHLADAEALTTFLKKGAAAYKKSMVMFYAPWCGYCKKLKPEYIAAALDLKGEALLAAIDVSRTGNSKIRQLYNITGFPTLIYYDKGQLRHRYAGDNKKQAIVDFIRDPTAHLAKKRKEEAEENWSMISDMVHLTAETFNGVVSKAEHALVVFYAPWCGHCKRIKPEFEKAAGRIISEKINGVLAAVDATKQQDVAKRFGVKGYPTLKYFRNGELEFDVSYVRREEQIISFLKDPRAPPPTPSPEEYWNEEDSSVRHLHSSNFRQTIRKIKHALVMFYAPWCGHCKNTKPEFLMAAERFADELMVMFVAVDCTRNQELCSSYNINGYPIIKYFSYFNKIITDYTGNRKEDDFVAFVRTLMKEAAQRPPPTPQEAGFGVNVVMGNDKNFESLIADSKLTFVMFFATWCSHCVEAKPEFSKLATMMKTDVAQVQVVAVDAAENPKAADLADVQSLPTFKMFGMGHFLEDYKGDRSVEDMAKFCKGFSKVKEEL